MPARTAALVALLLPVIASADGGARKHSTDAHEGRELARKLFRDAGLSPDDSALAGVRGGGNAEDTPREAFARQRARHEATRGAAW